MKDRDDIAHPDANELAGFAEGRLDPQRRARLQAHLLGCDPCREIAATLVRDPRRAARRAVLRGSLAAALLLAGAGLVLYASGIGQHVEATNETLAAAAADLAREMPDRFEGFTPLSETELMAARASVERGGVPIHRPAGLVLENRPGIAWTGEPGVARWRVRMLQDDGGLLWEAGSTTTVLEYPPEEASLAPGRGFVVAVAGSGPLGEAAGSRRFRVASSAEHEDMDESLHAIEASAPAGLAGILQAHLAIRQEAYGLAEACTRGHLDERPKDLLARQTLMYVLAVTGSPQAEDLRAELNLR